MSKAKKTLREEIIDCLFLDRQTDGAIKDLLNLFSQFGDRVIGSEERVTIHSEDGEFLREGEGYQTRNQLRKEQRKRKEELLKEKNG